MRSITFWYPGCRGSRSEVAAGSCGTLVGTSCLQIIDYDALALLASFGQAGSVAVDNPQPVDLA